ncbi:MAG: asparagine synthase (glutamine-hydrolyzing) [Blastocatellia bacterium]
MSGIAGIYHRTGQPVAVGQLRLMTDAAAHRGMDDAGYWVSGAVGLGHRMFHTTPESLSERQPLTDESGQLCLTFDGRVDNREDLRRELEADGFRLRFDTDAEIVLRAYQRWDEQCALKIIGDFALAIWDGRQQRLYCARDFFGIRPFNYFLNDRTFLFASELHQLFEHEGVPQNPNEGMIGEMLCGDIWNAEETLWQGILRLPPAHFLIVSPHGVRKERYWQVDPSRQIRYRRDEEYADHCRELIREAVRCRLRSHGPVAADLSGGLDSSSVVSMAQHLIQGGEASVAGFKTFSRVFPGKPNDESQFINDVIHRWDLEAYTTMPYAQDMRLYAERVRRFRDFPGYPNSTAGNRNQQVMCSMGCRVLLTGEGGDEWFGGVSDSVAELLKQGEWLRAIRLAVPAEQHIGLRTFAAGTLRALARNCLPKEWLRSYRKRRLQKLTLPAQITPQFGERIRLRQRRQCDEAQPSFEHDSQSSMYGSLTMPWNYHAFEVAERDALAAGVEWRHPLEDRRIVEFGFAIPNHQLLRGDLNKFVLRQAMRGLLPESVTRRTDKAEFSSVFYDNYRLLSDGGVDIGHHLVSEGWLVEEKLKEMNDHMRHLLIHWNGESWGALWTLWMIYGVELWWKGIMQKNNLDNTVLQSGK